jgi:DNA-binding transcriptional regulator YhcF (GntR family)
VQLPGTREFAVEVGANRNTVAKVYGALAREGLLQIVPGRGAFVMGRIDASAGQEPSEQVAHLLEDAVSRARLFGLTREAVLGLVHARISAVYDGASPRFVFVECNPYDAQLGSSELSTQLGIPVDSILLSDIPASGAVPFDVATTSLFHIEEVERLLSARAVRVIAVNTFPESDALLAMARLSNGTRVGIVAANQAGVERFNMLVLTYCHAEIRSLIKPSDAALDDLVSWAEVLVSGLASAAQARRRAAGRPVIVLAFHVDRQSVQSIRSEILVAGREEVLV